MDGYLLLDTHGPDAAAIADFWWVLLAATGVPAVIVIVALLLGLRSKGNPRPSAHVEDRNTALILGLGGLLPLAIVIALLTLSVQLGTRLTAGQRSDALTIDVIGRQFWWEVHYPDHGIVTANEIHIPTGENVRLRLTAGDVIHSFWVPQLQGKRDLIPGQITELWLQADEPGVYRGQCAEFCGVQHALMLLEVVAQPRDTFDRWLEMQKHSWTVPVSPSAQRGLEVFERLQCGHCHTIRGLVAQRSMGAVGPDLTHVGSRRTLGAGILANNRGNLGGWILNPQTLKPGNHMPDSTMPSEDLHALIHFLETLQ